MTTEINHKYVVYPDWPQGVRAVDPKFPIRVEKDFKFDINARTSRIYDHLNPFKEIGDWITSTCEANEYVRPDKNRGAITEFTSPGNYMTVVRVVFDTRKKTDDELYVEKLEYFLKQNNIS